MKQYIPYIVILLISYLVVAFVKMQFNPAYWEQEARFALMVIVLVLMALYSFFKFIE
jgi:hypothetical protein